MTGPRPAASGRARRTWLVWGALTAVLLAALLGLLGVLAGWPASDRGALWVVAAPIPVAVVLAAVPGLRPWGAPVLRQTIVWGGMVVGAVAVFAVVVVGFEGRPGEDQRATVGLSMLAAGVIAALALPARRWLERVARRSVEGDAVAADAGLRAFTRHLSRALPMDEILRQVAEAVHGSLAVDRAEIWTGTGSTLDLAVAVPDRDAASLAIGTREATVAAGRALIGPAAIDAWVPGLRVGREDRGVAAAPIVHAGRLLGLIVLESPETDAALGPDVEDALVEVARQLGLALHNVNLDGALQRSLAELRARNADLASSRARLVAASDEARRRIERDLHDGAQQRLVTLAVKLGLARQLLATDLDEVAGLLDELRGDVEVTLDELRELARGVYPPLLAGRGLGEALTAAASRASVTTTVHAPGLRRYGRDIEAAIYFCCLEAIQNASKHAGGSATIAIEVAESDVHLAFTIADDGVGFDPAHLPEGHGGGLTAMADRLGAVGGTVRVTSVPGAGTTVRGRVPVPPDPGGDAAR